MSAGTRRAFVRAVAIWAVLALARVIAAEDGPQTATPAGWNAAALATADQLARKLRAAAIVCEAYEPSPFGIFDADYRGRLPLPGAMASCESTNQEDLTFEVFKDAAAAREFLAGKQALICKRSADIDIDFPGFPYVEGDTWIIEPDEKTTADRLAAVLGGVSKVGTCTK